MKARFPEDDVQAMVESALEHCRFMDELGFDRFVVSLKDSHPRKVIEANRRFAGARPDVPLHLGVTEAGIPPEGVIKTRVAFEQLLSRGIGDTLRVRTIMRTRSLNLTRGSQPSSRRAFLGIPQHKSTSRRAEVLGVATTYFFHSSPRSAKASSESSRTEWVSPVAIT